MKKIYISCYLNNDGWYKEYIIGNFINVANSQYDIVRKDKTEINAISRKPSIDIVENVKKIIFKDSEICIFLIGLETKLRRDVDWEARAAMYDVGMLKKCGIIIIYLPEVTDKYGTKIPRSLLPTILQKNVQSKDVFVVETTWDNLFKEENAFDKYISVAEAYGKMSHYELDDNILKDNVNPLKF